jgi:hypothetical protein
MGTNITKHPATSIFMTPEHYNEYLILFFIYSQFNDGVSNSKYAVFKQYGEQ